MPEPEQRIPRMQPGDLTAAVCRWCSAPKVTAHLTADGLATAAAGALVCSAGCDGKVTDD